MRRSRTGFAPSPNRAIRARILGISTGFRVWKTELSSVFWGVPKFFSVVGRRSLARNVFLSGAPLGMGIGP